MTLTRLFKSITLSVTVLTFTACADEPEQPAWSFSDGIATTVITEELLSPEDYQKKCIRHEWYYCDLNAQWRMEITKNICYDPPKILSVGECEEFLECDPSTYLLDTVPCITVDGFPGTQDKVCDKGKIQYTDCISLCEEEICDGEDNDCDDLIDEDQLNACGECGFVPPEICDNVDNDCDSATDEDLLQDCSTDCGVGVEFCIGGLWAACTAPPVQIEICDGFDNDCDGSIDEGLTCECTIDHVGVLFPCNEPPLICGQGYKTCECYDPQCTEIYTTPCKAPCVYFPDPDEVCDETIGMALKEEECNNFDDNCNELIDEDLYMQCYSADPSTMYVGICLPGLTTCLSGVWGNYKEPEDFITGFCKDEVVPQEDYCDGEDNDCDGLTDSGEELEDTDILFIVDWSGSMDTEIYAVMGALNKFAGHYSDEQVIQWGTIIGPLRNINIQDWYEHLNLYHNLTGFTDFLSAMSQLNTSSYTMTGSKEMLLDALYLSIYNLAGGAAPYPLSDLSWNSSKGVPFSVPDLNQFKVNWRAGSNRVIVLFTDERAQSYLIEEITPPILKQTISAAPDLKIYTFTTPSWKEGTSWAKDAAWEQYALESGGKWYELTSDMLTMYQNLMEIIDENACK